MREFDEIRFILRDNILKIFLIVIAFAMIFYTLFYLNIWTPTNIFEVRNNVQQAKHFKGFKINNNQSLNEFTNDQNTQTDAIFNNHDSHLLIYGQTESGKTTFLKRYINAHYNQMNVFIFCRDTNEWKGFPNVINGTDDGALFQLENTDKYKGAPDNRNLIILDDMGGLISQKMIAEIFTKGRHDYIQIIFLGHKPKDVDNKIRGNIKKFYVTTANTSEFFYELNDTYKIRLPLVNFQTIEYGIIVVDLIKNTFIIYDKNLSIINNSNTNYRTLPTEFNIQKFLNIKKFTEKEKDDITLFLEQESDNTIDVTDETFLFYLNYYFIQNLKLQPNLNKLRKMVSESKNNLTLIDITNDANSLLKSFKPIYNELSTI